MQDIVYCRSQGEWSMRLAESYPLFVLPQARIIVKDSSSLYRDMISLKPVGRLGGVKQLGLANCCGEMMRGTSQTRYEHSLIFAAKADYMSQKLGLDRTLAVAAAGLHDIGSTALSDSVAKATGISDELYFEKVVDGSEDVKRFLKNYGVSRDAVVSLVKGEDKSPLGQLINSKGSIDADRWSYVTRDAANIFMDPKIWLGHYTPDPLESASIVDGRIVFGDIREVTQFLEARVKMYESVYKHEQLMAKEAFMGDLVREIQKSYRLDASRLLEMDDDGFKEIALRHGGDLAHRMFGIDGFKMYGQLEGSERDVAEYIGGMTKSPLAVKRQKLLDPATETPILIDDVVVPYRKLEPIHAAGLMYRSKKMSYTTVYGYDADEDLERAFSKAREKFGEPMHVSDLLKEWEEFSRLITRIENGESVKFA